MSFSNEEIQEFKTEAIELLDVAEKCLLAIGHSGGGGADFKRNFDTAFRAFHNLKGGAGMMEMMHLQGHTHQLESILMPFKTATSMSQGHIDMFLRGIDAARLILDGQTIQFDYSITAVAAAAPTAPAPATEEVPGAAEFLNDCDEMIERITKALQYAEAGNANYDINELYRDVHSLKGGAYLFSYENLGNLAHVVESSLDPIREGSHVFTKAMFDTLFKIVGVLELEITCIRRKVAYPKMKELIRCFVTKLEAAKPQPKMFAASAPIEAVVEVPAPPVLQVEPSEPKIEPEPDPMPLPKIEAKPEPVKAESIKVDNEASSTIRVSVPLLDSLMTLMGEMVLVRNQVIQYSNRSEDLEFLNLSKRLNVVTSEIQGELMKTRMQPIGNVLGKFTRVVRDLSQELGKHITLSVQGSETELDKSLLEAIKDPLTHIIRNSCDHGIELPQVRRQAGKPEGGQIAVRAFHEGGQVVIEVSDDGKGLAREALLRKAIEKGLITDAQAKGMAEKEVFNLIFAPGFSTAAAVTNVSGRGVGMDVVRTNIERIGGTVELSSVQGRGTQIRIKIPLTLAIVPALIVTADQKKFAIPQVKLMELVRVDQSSPQKIEYIQGAPIYRLRGNLLPLVDLNEVLKTGRKSTSTIVNIAVLNAEHCSFGLIIEEIEDTADIVVKPLNRLLKSLQVYSGATVLGDGSVALILDVLGLSKVAQVGRVEALSAGTEVEQGESQGIGEHQDYLLIRVNSPTKHAIVLQYIHRLEEFSHSQVELSAGTRGIRYGNVILPLISVSEMLGYDPGSAPTDDATFSVLVIERAGKFFGLQVDEIIDTMTSLVEVMPSPKAAPCVYGNLNAPEELVVVIDPFDTICTAFPEERTVRVRATQSTPVKKPAHSGPTRILLVEDTPFFRRAVSRVLENAGHVVTIANDGEEALEVLARDANAFDLIVSDIEMPRKNGFELAEAVRANPEFAHLPMMAVSSKADQAHVSKGLAAGFNMYLEKLKSEMLLAAIAELLNLEKVA